MPASGSETAKYRMTASAFIEMKRLRVEFGGKAFNALSVDASSAGTELLSRRKIFQVSLGHIGYLPGEQRSNATPNGYMMLIMIELYDTHHI